MGGKGVALYILHSVWYDQASHDTEYDLGYESTLLFLFLLICLQSLYLFSLTISPPPT